MRNRRDGLTPEKRTALVKALRQYGNVRDACRVAGTSKTSYYRHRDADPAFRARCVKALGKAAKPLADLAWKRAVEGTEEKVIRDGKVVQIKVRQSDSLLKLLLQASDPGKYGGALALVREQIEAELRPKIEAELRAELGPKRITYKEGSELRKQLEKMLSDFNRRMGGNG